MGEMRIEKDSMGEMEVPASALWGASTQRAVLNFPISGYRFGRRFIRALGLIKFAAAEANKKLGRLDVKVASAIQQAAREVMGGQHDAHFVLDIFQTGSGTSTNMNANEVIANRATQVLGGAVGSKLVHPNDHVNMGQSSNDVIPTAMHVAIVEALHQDLMPALHALHKALKAKAEEFHDIIKIGRTHLMDATPIRLGQEFSGYASQIAHCDRRIMGKIIILRELAIGGTAVGTGINTHPQFARLVCEIINHETHESFHEAQNHFEAQAAKDAVVEASGVLRTIAIGLTKIANDIRWLGSGPRCGLGELLLPETQPGSSIMPGKVNPVICEAMLQTCAQVIGNDAAVTYAAATLGNLDLHVGMPVMAHNVLESVRILGAAVRVFDEKCVRGLRANRQRCEELVEQSLAMCTSLAPLIGYDAAAAIAKEAAASGKTVRQVAMEKRVLPEDQLRAALDPAEMTHPSERVLPVSA
ncbi:MAG: class II fumarate hydratase [Phycisphaerales bacterium]|nr:class II fumarate hydratase [Phycisphaerales bacterium]